MQSNTTQNWWKYGVVYHIYPTSFKDSNNDGIIAHHRLPLRLRHLVLAQKKWTRERDLVHWFFVIHPVV